MNSSNQLLEVNWVCHNTNMKRFFSEYMTEDTSKDVTIICNDYSIKVHGIVLQVSSVYFDNLFKANKDSIKEIQLRHVKGFIMRALITYMYTGTLRVLKSALDELVITARYLQIKGFAAVNELLTESDESYNKVPMYTTNPRKKDSVNVNPPIELAMTTPLIFGGATGSMWEKVPGSTLYKKCKLCGKIVKCYSHRYVHGNGFHCVHCPRKYKRKQDLKVHVRQHHGNLSSTAPKKSNYKCVKTMPIIA